MLSAALQYHNVEFSQLHAYAAELAREEERRNCEQNLHSFVKAAWHVLEPGTEFIDSWHLEYLAEHLELVSRGECKRLCVNVPPRSLKSTIVTICWPIWTWITQPSSRWLFVSYSQQLSATHSIARRNLLTSPWFQGHWGHLFKLADDNNRAHDFSNDKRGRMYASSSSGSLTGIGAGGGGAIVCDDFLSAQEAASDAERETGLRNFDQGVMTRMDDPRTTPVVVIEQRLHVSDISGHILSKGNWSHVRLPAEAEANETIVFPRSKRVVTRKIGDPLQPGRQGAKEIAEARAALGSYVFEGQFQQRPNPLGGGLIKTSLFKRYQPHELPKEFQQLVIAWDLTFKKSTTSDFVAGCAVGCIGAERWVLEVIRARADFRESCEMVLSMSQRFPQASAVVVERAANGEALTSMLAQTIPGLVLQTPKGSKVERVNAFLPALEGGQIYLPADGTTSWLPDFIAETEAFPRGRNDDQCDALSSALIYARHLDEDLSWMGQW